MRKLSVLIMSLILIVSLLSLCGCELLFYDYDYDDDTPTYDYDDDPVVVKEVTMPDLYGTVLSTAISTLKNMGFTNIDYDSEDADNPWIFINSNWTVVSQNVTSHQTVRTDKKIILGCLKTTTFEANKTITMPDCVGLTETESAKLLANAGFTNVQFTHQKLATRYKEITNKSLWKVDSQDRDVGQAVKAGAKITLTCSLIIITKENNSDFAELLTIENAVDEKVKTFAEKYDGKILEFDACVTKVNSSSGNYMYDTYFCGGDYNGVNNLTSAIFSIKDNSFSGMYVNGLSSIAVGLNCHVYFQIDQYNANDHSIEVIPILIKARENQETHLEEIFPKETAQKAITVAITNALAGDVKTSGVYDPSKFHDSTYNGLYKLTLYEDGTWQAMSTTTWRVTYLYFYYPYANTYLQVHCDIGIEESQYRISIGYIYIGTYNDLDKNKTENIRYINLKNDDTANTCYLNVSKQLLDNSQQKPPVDNTMPTMSGTSIDTIKSKLNTLGFVQEFSDSDWGDGTMQCTLESKTNLTIDIVYSKTTKEILSASIIPYATSTTTAQQEFICTIANLLCPSTSADAVTQWINTNIGSAAKTTIDGFVYELSFGTSGQLLYDAGVENWEQWVIAN